MRIRKLDGYSIECENCCDIHFYEDETWISNDKYDEGLKLISYSDWLDLPLERAIELGGEDNGNWYSLMYNVWVVCPNCGQWHKVWYDRLYHVLAQSSDKWARIPLKDLIKDNKVTLVKHIDYEDMGTKCVYGAETEVI